MARLCTVCSHTQRHEIDAALLEHATGYAKIAGRYGLVLSSVQRHAQNHLGAFLRKSKAARLLMDADSLVAEMNRLHTHTRGVIQRAEANHDERLVLLGVAEGRRNAETLAKLGALGSIEERLRALEQKGAADVHTGDRDTAP